MPDPLPLAPRPPATDAPLSFAQQRLWFLDSMGAGAAFHVPVAMHLAGPLDVARLEAALARAVARHASLRTTLVLASGEPVQRVAPTLTIPLERHDATADASDVERLALEQVARPFDLATGPLIRAHLIAAGPTDHLLLLVLHHAITDGVSGVLLAREIGAGYAGAPEPPRPEVDYGDFAAWQREVVGRGGLARERAWWTERLAGLGDLALPLDRPRPPALTYRGASVSFEVPDATARALRAQAAGAGTTLANVLLAAWQALLARIGGATDVATGVQVANRSRVELEPLVGLFTNTLVLRTDLGGDPAFLGELVPRVQETALAAYEHQELPFQQLVEALAPPRDPGRHPLVTTMFGLSVVPGGGMRLGELTVTPRELPATHTGLELDLRLRDEGERLAGRLIHSTDVFDPGTAEDLVERFGALLAAVAQDPNRRLSALPLLTAREGRVFAEVNAAARSDLTPEERLAVPLRVARRAGERPDAPAVTSGAATWTYGELADRVARLAAHLRALGAGPGERVAVCMQRSVDLPVALLGVLASGAAYVPLDPTHPAARQAAILADAEARFAIVQGANGEDSLPIEHVVDLERDADALATGAPVEFEAPPPESPAYLVYTSGSTGRPKGVEVPHRALANLLAAVARRPGCTADDVLLAVTTVAFDIAALELLLPLTLGGRVEVAPDAAVVDGRALAALLAASGATLMQATPATWRMLLEAGPGALPADLRVLCGGEALPRELAERILARGCTLWNLYGPSETTIWSLAQHVESGAGAVPIGTPLANTSVHVLDPWGAPAPVGTEGELLLGGDGLATGYWRAPEATAHAFGPAPGVGTERLYRTGDRVVRRRDGSLVFRGRGDRQVKLRGHRIEPGEIESALTSHPDVAACVVQLLGEGGTEHLVAHVVPGTDADAGVDVPALRSFLQGRLPRAHVPTRFVAHDALPLTPNGKVDRAALARSAADGGGQAAAGDAPLETDAERWLAEIWARHLGLERLGAEDNYFDLGGHSLLVMKIVEEVERESGARLLPMEVLVQTLRQLARACAERGTIPESGPGEGKGWLGRLRARLGPGI